MFFFDKFCYCMIFFFLYQDKCSEKRAGLQKVPKMFKCENER